MANLRKGLLIAAAALLAILVIAALAAYDSIFGFGELQVANTPLPGTLMPPEQAVLQIPLDGPIADEKAELSGLAWYGDYLILLPQYPARMGAGDGIIFALPRQEIMAFIEGKSSTPLTPLKIPLSTGGFDANIRGFEGFEAIAFHDQQVYLTIEAQSGGKMSGYLISGEILADLSEIRLEAETLTEIPMQLQSYNKSDEALFLAGEQFFTLYEVNGEAFNPAPRATCFTLSLTPCVDIAFPHLEYRLTDATVLDEQGRFWVINYQFPGDLNIKPKSDPLANQYGQGASHSVGKSVERLVEYQYSDGSIQRTQRAPIQLQLVSDARNWEGIVRLDSLGFLLVTDKFPGTILGFVEMPHK